MGAGELEVRLVMIKGQPLFKALLGMAFAAGLVSKLAIKLLFVDAGMTGLTKAGFGVLELKLTGDLSLGTGGFNQELLGWSMALLAVLDAGVGINEWKPRPVVIEDQPLTKVMGGVARFAVAAVDLGAKLAIGRQSFMHVRVTAFTEALFGSRELHDFFAVLKVAGIAGLDLTVSTGKRELGHTIVIKAILPGGYF